MQCDEVKPLCKKCQAYGVECNYSDAGAALRVSSQGTFTVDFEAIKMKEVEEIDVSVPASNIRTGETLVAVADSDRSAPRSSPIGSISSLQRPVSLTSTMATLIDDSIQYGHSIAGPGSIPTAGAPWDSSKTFWHFQDAHYEILFRFHNRTALTIADKRIAPGYRDCLSRLAVSVGLACQSDPIVADSTQHPFLMHMLLGLTLMHDADLVHSRRPELYASHKIAALQHWNSGSKLFNQILANPVSDAQKDAVWATGVLIGATSFWYLHSDNIEDVWPLKPPEADDLAWLRLGEGKKSLWQIANPTRPDSIFYPLMKDRIQHCSSVPAWVNTIDMTKMRVPQRVKDMFNITPNSTFRNNVYHLPIFVLSRIQNVHLTHSNVVSFMYFTAFITRELLQLLEIRDPRAVFILGWWFCIIEDGDLWWMASRAKIEGRAVRFWLRREGNVYGLADVLEELRRQPRERREEKEDVPIEIWAHDWQTEGTSCKH